MLTQPVMHVGSLSSHHLIENNYTLPILFVDPPILLASIKLQDPVQQRVPSSSSSALSAEAQLSRHGTT